MTFFIDQFGVLRDDTGPYEARLMLYSNSGIVGQGAIVILSNSGRSGEYNSELIKLGYGEQL